MINSRSLLCASLLLLSGIPTSVFAGTAKKSVQHSHRHSNQCSHCHNHNNDNDDSIVERAIYTGISLECLAWAVGGLSFAYGYYNSDSLTNALTSNYAAPINKLVDGHKYVYGLSKPYISVKTAGIAAIVAGSYIAYRKARKFYNKARRK